MGHLGGPGHPGAATEVPSACKAEGTPRMGHRKSHMDGVKEAPGLQSHPSPALQLRWGKSRLLGDVGSSLLTCGIARSCPWARKALLASVQRCAAVTCAAVPPQPCRDTLGAQGHAGKSLWKHSREKPGREGSAAPHKRV